MRFKYLLLTSALALAGAALAEQAGVSPGPGVRYATDAYPGFDSESEIVSPAKKEPRWFQWFTGPKMSDPASQFACAEQLAAEESWSSAAKEYDALVRNWPTSPEAPKAQRALADIRLNREYDCEEAFAEYRYLFDFYSNDCDSAEVIALMYKIAGMMRLEGKTICFFRFKNTTDVRRAFEAVVLRAPGAKFAPEAMLTVAALREEEMRLSDAIAVYENIRNRMPDVPEAMTALHGEARARMTLLRDHGYNRARVRDTIGFLEAALAEERLEAAAREEIRGWLDEAKAQIEAEAFRSAKFYDSRTRTKRSAISAYRQYLEDFPSGEHAGEVRARIEELSAEGEAKEETK